MNKMISACGIDCLSCECFEATRTGDPVKKQEIAGKWSKQYEAEITAADINCDGCMTGENHFGWCYKCPIRACVSEKSYQSCAECPDFPCPKSEFIINNVPDAKSNIESLRK
jgi:hypothetical protein